MKQILKLIALAIIMTPMALVARGGGGHGGGGHSGGHGGGHGGYHRGGYYGGRGMCSRTKSPRYWYNKYEFDYD